MPSPEEFFISLTSEKLKSKESDIEYPWFLSTYNSENVLEHIRGDPDQTPHSALLFSQLQLITLLPLITDGSVTSDWMTDIS